MIKLDDNKNVWVTSDTHYSHKNICRGATKWRTKDNEVPIENTRDFITIEEMNDAIVNNINNLVRRDDILIHLGDWSFGGFENIKELYDRLICKNIHLILGNHDHHIEKNVDNIQSLFSSVSWFQQVKYQDEIIECMHYPIESWNALRKGRIHLHGHCHLPNHMKITKGRRMDIGMDGNPLFEPYNLADLIQFLKTKNVGSESINMA
jgi:calcineurin-like phosphoesterase family protein